MTRLQQALLASGQKLDLDGIFASGTDSAVRTYQKRTNLSADGIVGPKTWEALMNEKSPRGDDTSSPAGRPT